MAPIVAAGPSEMNTCRPVLDWVASVAQSSFIFATLLFLVRLDDVVVAFAWCFES